jgi:hypothetical protein
MHLAMKVHKTWLPALCSTAIGLSLAATAAVVCQGGITMKNYNSRMEVSWVNEELERVRNIRPGFRCADPVDSTVLLLIVLTAMVWLDKAKLRPVPLGIFRHDWDPFCRRIYRTRSPPGSAELLMMPCSESRSRWVTL